MSRFRSLVLLLSLLLMTVSSAMAAPYRVNVTAGTRVPLRAQQDVLSNKVKAGQTINLTAASSVRVRGVTIIAAGAPAHGSVVYSRGSGVGFAGEMMIVLMDVQAVDGSWIPLRAQPQGGDARARLLPSTDYDLVGAPFPAGKNARLSYRRVFNGFTDAARGYIVNGSRISIAVPLTPPGKRLIKLPDGVVVRVQPTRELSSGQLNTGDRVDFITMAPVEVGGATVIAQGAPAYGTVLLARHAKMGNKGGLLVMSVDRVKAVDGTEVRLSASSAGRGDGNKALGTAASMLIVPFIGLAIEGREAVVHQNKEIDVFVFLNRYVAVRR